MKVYIGYLILTESEYRKVTGIINYNLVSYDEEKDKYHILFGHTPDKKLWNKFSMIHKRLEKRVVHMSEEEYDKFTIRYKMAKIVKIQFRFTFKEEISLPVTIGETINVVDDVGEDGDGGYMMYMSDIAPFAQPDPRIFNNKIVRLLENIWYVHDHFMVYGTDDETDYILYNESYRKEERNFNEVFLFYTLYEQVIDFDGLRMYLIKEVEKDDKD